MPEDAGLTERERQLLRLFARGHDAKSCATQLGLSIHTVNAYLREARRKLGASSSREAARRLAALKDATPENLASDFSAVAGTPPIVPDPPAGSRRRWMIPALAVGAIGGLSMSLLTLLLVNILSADGAAQSTDATPQVVRTLPAGGATIAPGPFTLSVTFDRAMAADSYSFVRVAAETYPDCDQAPQLSRDRRTVSLSCHARPGARYELWFNRPPYMNFRSERGVSAAPYRLTFAVAAK